MDFEIDRAGLTKALLDLGIDPETIPDLTPVQPPPQAPPYQPLSDIEWKEIQRHVAHAIRLMRPREAARSFIDNLLVCQRAGLSTRYLSDDQESARQRNLRWSLDGRLEKLAADLRASGELHAERLAEFDALAEKAKARRERILGARAVRLTSRLDKPTER
jgi:hypothetical protein